jgi:hypothetical protein
MRRRGAAILDQQPARGADKTAARRRYFARNELARLCMDALRGAPGLITTDEIASQVIAAKGFDGADSILRAAIREQMLTVLRAARKRGTVEQVGLGRGVRWKLAPG